jgi:putative DNA methylase
MRKKLIEIVLPLEAINKASFREKSIRHGHPSTLHLWWARRLLAVARAVIFASLVDDLSSNTDLFFTEMEQIYERQQLFDVIEKLIIWGNSNDIDLLSEAQAETKKSCGDSSLEFLDPFAGGGFIPLEARRLGLKVHASDLNLVAVMDQ